MKIYLIRHAKTKDAKSMITQRDTTSIYIDKETIKKTKDLQLKFESKKIDAIYCSPLVRSQETAKLIFPNKKFKILSFIKEYKTPKEILGKSRETAIKYWEIEHKADKLNIKWKPEKGESFEDIAKRAKMLYEYLKNDKKIKKFNNVVIVGHGTFFRHFLLQTAQIPYLEFPQIFFTVLRKLDWDNLKMIEIEI